MANEIVKYSNKMNKIPLAGYSKRDLNFFYSICAKVKDRNSELVELSFEEIATLSNYGDFSHPERLREDLQDMRKKVLSTQFQYETDTVDRMGNLFSTLDIKKDEDAIKVRVNVDFIDYFNALVSEFTSFELEQYVSLDSRYAKNLYRLLKQWKTQGKTPKYTVEELKDLLSTPDYKPMIFMRDIIKPAVEELKKKRTFSNLWCEVVYKKGRGKPVDGYIFHFRKDEIEGQMSFETWEYGKCMPKSKPKNKFNQFEQQDYNIAELEEQILSN